jgi:hypothetical protein
MTPDQFREWQQQATPSAAGQRVTEADVAKSYAETRKLVGEAPEVVYRTSPPSPPQVRPATEVWGQDTSFDFVCPSGAQCRMQRLSPERLLEEGVIDDVTRLPGLTQELIDKSEMKPPKAASEPVTTTEEIKSLVRLLDIIVPMAVLEPKIYPRPDKDTERQQGRIYTDSIELVDRVAIMNKSMEGVVKLDAFRNEA